MACGDPSAVAFLVFRPLSALGSPGFSNFVPHAMPCHAIPAILERLGQVSPPLIRFSIAQS